MPKATLTHLRFVRDGMRLNQAVYPYWPWVQKIHRLPWHWMIEIYNQKIWLNPAYPGPLEPAPSVQWINRHCR
ncbi:hypothetical protein TNCV_3882001 [Trichonephila clavipes]|nr:hypothetical protein TNCV_3882001 [Trichonephila clavipes]